jgi:dephospho-CoA kinase
LEAFDAYSHREENRALLSILMEYWKHKEPNRFITPMLAYIQNLPEIIIEDIYYFKELETFIKLGAKVVLIETEQPIRKERGWRPSMDNNPLEYEVASITSGMVRDWRNVVCLKNNKTVTELRNEVKQLFI